MDIDSWKNRVFTQLVKCKWPRDRAREAADWIAEVFGADQGEDGFWTVSNPESTGRQIARAGI